MKPIKHVAAVIGMGLLAASACIGAPALATGGSGISVSNFVTGHYGLVNENTAQDKTGKWGMVLKTLDDTDIGADDLTLQAGGFTGWHAHPSPVFVTVTEGTIVLVDGSDPLCTPHTYSAGQSFIEGAYRVHNVQNNSGSVAKFKAIRIHPTGVAFRIDEVKPNNCNF
jgi:quercetin dioxygenase-like cupin family protein